LRWPHHQIKRFGYAANCARAADFKTGRREQWILCLGEVDQACWRAGGCSFRICCDFLASPERAAR
jgi:hypothetical protein